MHSIVGIQAWLNQNAKVCKRDTIPQGAISIEPLAFAYCAGLTGVYFQGKAPAIDYDLFYEDGPVTVYYLPGTTGWGATFAGNPTAIWSPMILTGGAGFAAGPDGFGFLISWATNATVAVEASPTLTPPLWTPVSTNTLTAGTSPFTDPQWANYPACLYRLSTQ
jgi:hypothetical protein